MNLQPNNFKLGLFVLIGILLLLGGVFIFGASKWFEGKTVQETYVSGNVDGLKVGAPVTLRGVPVGQVTKINFTWNVYHRAEPRYVYIEFEVDSKVSLAPPGRENSNQIEQEIKKGLRARIKSQGLAAGTSIVSLEYVDPNEHPPLKVPWTPRHLYIPSAPGQFSEIIASLDQTLASIRQIDFQKIGTLVQADLASAERVLNRADELNLRELGTNLNHLIAEVRGVAGQARSFIGNTNQLAQSNLEQLASRANNLLAQVQTTLASLNGKLTAVDTTSLNDTLGNLQRASRDLDETINQIKQYPSGAIFGEPPAPARSVERPR